LTEFLLNVAPLKITWDEDWQIFEIEVDNWDDRNDYKAILKFKRTFQDDSLVIETHGRHLILIPSSNKSIEENNISKISSKIEEILEKSIRLNKIDNPLERLEKEDAIFNVLRKGIGEVITKELEKLGFEKIGSGGGIGEFSLPLRWQEEEQVIFLEKGQIRRTFMLTILASNKGKQFYLAADLKGRYREKQLLPDWLKIGKISKTSVQDWDDKDKTWLVEINSSIQELFNKNIEREYFEIQSIEEWNDIKDKALQWGRHSKLTVDELKNKGKIQVKDGEKFVLVKPFGRIIRNPNISIPVPMHCLYRHLSQPISRNPKHENQYKRFTQLTPQKRNRYITSFFRMLNAKGISESEIRFPSYSVRRATPSVGNNIVAEYGKIPYFDNWGVEFWGNLKKILIVYSSSNRNENKIKEFAKLLEDYILKVQQNTKSPIKEVTLKIHAVNHKSFFRDQFLNGLDGSCCPIIIRDKYISNYKELKARLTQERGVPIQVIRENTIRSSRSLQALVRTVFPQILAKTGGLPYKLAPPLLDKAIIIGLDKARDSSGRRPSASAGIAAVTPTGYYIAGTSTPLENNTTDFIDVNKLAPPLLRELQERKFENEYDFVVILRDGSPKTCKDEIPIWERYLKEHDKEFIFLASRKTHAYRVFPSNISNIGGKVKYDIPIILNGNPLPESDFLVLAARAPRGTPKPVLYTVMKNTTNFSTAEIKEKVLAQIISMSMLCWESPLPTSQPLPLHYADKLAEFTQLVQQAWSSSNRYPMFI